MTRRIYFAFAYVCSFTATNRPILHLATMHHLSGYAVFGLLLSLNNIFGIYTLSFAKQKCLRSEQTCQEFEQQ